MILQPHADRDHLEISEFIIAKAKHRLHTIVEVRKVRVLSEDISFVNLMQCQIQRSRKRQCIHTGLSAMSEALSSDAKENA